MIHPFLIYSTHSPNCRCIGDKQQYFVLLPWAANFPSVFIHLKANAEKHHFISKRLSQRREETSCKRGNVYFLHLEIKLVDHPVPIFNTYKLNINMQYYKTVVFIRTVQWIKLEQKNPQNTSELLLHGISPPTELTQFQIHLPVPFWQQSILWFCLTAWKCIHRNLNNLLSVQ